MAKVIDTGNPAGEGNGAVNVDTGEFRALQDQVAALAERLEQVRRQACMVRAVEDVIANTSALEYAYSAGREHERGLRRGQQERHLRVVVDGA